MGKIIHQITICLFLLIVGHISAQENWGKCIGLALEGGGDAGAYQVGVLKAFAENLPRSDIEYDIVTGVSVGSINAMGLALHDKGKESDAIDWMLKLWSELNSSAIYSEWPLGVAEGLFFHEGIYNNYVELLYLNKTLEMFDDHKIKRMLQIETIDIDTGFVAKYDETIDYFDLAHVVRASTSMPFAFPHVHYDNHTYVDGGTVWNVDVDGVITRCRDKGFADKDIILDVILCNSRTNTTRDETKDYNTINNYHRYNEIKAYYGTLSDYLEIMRGYPDVDFRYFLVPQEDLYSGFIPLAFDHEAILAMIQIGVKEGAEAVKGNPEPAREKVQRLLREAFPKYGY